MTGPRRLAEGMTPGALTRVERKCETGAVRRSYKKTSMITAMVTSAHAINWVHSPMQWDCKRGTMGKDNSLITLTIIYERNLNENALNHRGELCRRTVSITDMLCVYFMSPVWVKL